MGFNCLGNYADKYYLLDIKRKYKNNNEKVFAIVWDNAQRKKKWLVVRKNGSVRINNESISFYALLG